MNKIVVLDGYASNPGDLTWDKFEEIGELKVYDRTKSSDVIDRIGDASYIFINKIIITKEIINACPNLKFIGVFATGYDIIDLDAASSRGIVVCNIPNYSTSAVAQFVFSLLLEICSNVGIHSNLVKDGKWSECKDFCFWNNPLIELEDKYIGIIGFGNIGQKVAKIANALGMNVLYYNRTRKEELEHSNLRYVELDEIYKLSDVISLHVPASKETKEIINKDSISKMKDGVIIINTARGALINEVSLTEALNSRKVYAAACDVSVKEPIDSDNPLLKCENFYLTPHIAWAPIETRKRMLDIACDNLIGFINGNIINQVNK